MSRKAQFLLTKEQHETRRKYIGGSDAKIIMEADPTKLIRLWQEKRGEIEPDDLSGILPVCFGTATEELNRYWFEEQTGKKITREGEHVVSTRTPFMACSLDGVVDGHALFEAKCTGGFKSFEKIAQRYMPQLHHSMYVCGFGKSYLSVFLGTGKWEVAEVHIDSDPFYLDLLLAREAEFWKCVQEGIQPAFEAVEPPRVADDDMRVVDMNGNNSWAVAAGLWIETKGPAAQNKKMAEELKLLVDHDVKLASGHGVKVSRGKDRKMRLTQLK